jgi:hypothetical protein
MPVSLAVDGTRRESRPDPRTTLPDALRERLHPTGTPKLRDHGGGARIATVDRVRGGSRLGPAATHGGREITAIGGPGMPEMRNPGEAAFVRNEGHQCRQERDSRAGTLTDRTEAPGTGGRQGVTGNRPMFPRPASREALTAGPETRA